MALQKNKVEKKNEADKAIEAMESALEKKKVEERNSAQITIADLKNETFERKQKSEENGSSGTKKKSTTKIKKKPGRPPLKDEERRQQYTLTLKPSLYNKILDASKNAKLSFALYMETAVEEYMKNHS